MSKRFKKCVYFYYMLCRTFLHTLVFADASSHSFLTFCRIDILRVLRQSFCGKFQIVCGVRTTRSLAFRMYATDQVSASSTGYRSWASARDDPSEGRDGPTSDQYIVMLMLSSVSCIVCEYEAETWKGVVKEYISEKNILYKFGSIGLFALYNVYCTYMHSGEWAISK